MRRYVPYFILLVLLIVLVAVASIHKQEASDPAEFWLRVISAFGVCFAVVVALYGDTFKSLANRLDLRIDEPPRVDSFMNPLSQPVYCHHLRVTNATPHTLVRNCRVWLVAIEDERPDGSFGDDYRFAVPRLMEWAPAEYSKDVRSFCEDQVFDFGKTWVDSGRFQLNFYQIQGGVFNGDCALGKRRRYLFKITADNFIRSPLYRVQVSVENITPTAD